MPFLQVEVAFGHKVFRSHLSRVNNAAAQLIDTDFTLNCIAVTGLATRKRLVSGYSKKGLHNECPKFTLSERVERETSSGANSVEDARRAFDNLFKK